MHVFIIAMSLLVGSLLGTAAWAAPTQRILLLEDRTQTSHEQAVVREALVAELFNDPDVQLLAPGVLPARMTRGAELRRTGCDDVLQARRKLAGRKWKEAQAAADRAVQKLWRAASLTGEVAPWLEARAVQAAVQAAQGREATAQRLFSEVFAMDAAFEDPALRRGASRRAVARARGATSGASQVTLRVRAVPSDAALWIDGRFAGYSVATLQVPAKSQHVVLATAPGHEPRAQVVTASALRRGNGVLGNGVQPQRDSQPTSQPQPPLRRQSQPQPTSQSQLEGPATTPTEVEESVLHLVPNPTNATMPYDELVAATRITEAFPDPNNPLFEALDPTSVWVLRYAQGGVHLAAFDLTTGRRHDASAPAVIFSLSDARDVARVLADQPPAVPALERPPTT